MHHENQPCTQTQNYLTYLTCCNEPSEHKL